TGLISSLIVGTFVPFLFKRFDLLLREFSSGLVLISPPIVLLILGTGDFLEKLSPEMVGFIYGLLGGLGVCYLVISTRVKELINSEFLNASRVIGASELQIALKHILPLIIPYSVALMLSVTTSGIVAYGFASFFGQVGWTPNWGMMIYDAITYGSYLGGTNLWNLMPPTFGFILCSSSFYLISISVKKQFGITL
ncbi:ABC transporter permease subunit, partial [Acidimicrobiia bacterium]|nr:ABC transporter permease subunit [Acidimicrobiia bacterium]